MLDEKQLLLQLEDMQVSLELSKLLEQHSKLSEDVEELQDELNNEELVHDDDGELQDELDEFALFDGEYEEILQDMMLDEK